MRVDEAVGTVIGRMGARRMFGVVGSGNFRVTNAMVRAGVRFTASRHEMGAACMADAYSRATGELAVLTVHQGCGFSNALTGIGEAAKAHTPLLVVTGDIPGDQRQSNFWIDQDKVAEGMGAVPERVHSADSAVRDVIRAVTTAVDQRRTVVLSLPLDLQNAEIPERDAARLDQVAPPSGPLRAAPAPEAVEQLAGLLAGARRPVIVGGRGARAAVGPIRRLAEAAGALLTTSAAGRGLFHEDEWHLDVMGGFSTEGAAELIAGADVLIAFGAALNRWTTRGGELLGQATVVQVDDRVEAFGFHHPVDVAVLGDAALTAEATTAALQARRTGADGTGAGGDAAGAGPGAAAGYRTPEVARTVAESLNWSDQPFEDTSEPVVPGEPGSGRIDPRTLTNALDRMLPMERVVVPDGGNFNAYPAMHFRVPDNDGYCVPLAFQSIGLALSSAIGAAVALPGRVAIAGVGDGGFMMSLVELDTAVRLGLPLVVVVYNDNAYGAEVHHFAHETDELDTVVFPETDIAAIATGYGCQALTVRQESDLEPVRAWVEGPRDRPLVIDAKITSFPSWVLAHSFEAGE
ncbi:MULTISPECIES: thiamine pyrophosphate-binding protein [Citricoccus]|uniref:thiamine pyrophosphate-binding protein n=1 Tax=Citricoccus TaxID=169133 RepID=UPI000255F670|nr:thiamine pyrophosphate-binding protein [Citricoccus sp. CH26A]